MGRNLCVDGHEYPDTESDWLGDGQFPPFAVFDIDAQKNLLPYYQTRIQAEEAMLMLRVDSLRTASASIGYEIVAATIALRKVCAHDWKWEQVAGEGKTCSKCGARDYSDD